MTRILQGKSIGGRKNKSYTEILTEEATVLISYDWISEIMSECVCLP